MMHLIDSPVWLALAWACLHFTWIGAVIGGVAAATRFALRGSAPEVRSRAALGFLLALLVAPFVTFFVVLSQTNPVATAGGLAHAAPFAAPAVAHGWFDRFLFFVPWLWIAGALIKHLVIVAGWWGTERLRRDARVAVSDDVSHTCRRLARSLGVTRRVAVGFSDRVAAPIVLGVVRPMILLPATLATGWVPERLEMILLHELAHVRRNDVLVHIVQRVTEALWFFHPAVWSVSRWLTLECEQCCDALVLDRTGRPGAYARTLVALSGGVRSPAAATLGAAMADRHLVTRIRRILNQEEARMQIHPRATLAVVALLTTSLMVWNAYAQKQCQHCGHEEPVAEAIVATGSIDVAPVADGRVVVGGKPMRAVRESSGSAIAVTAAPMPSRLEDVTDVLAVDPNVDAVPVPRAVIAGELAIDSGIAAEPAGARSISSSDPNIPSGAIAVSPLVADVSPDVYVGELAVATAPIAVACPPNESDPVFPGAPRAIREVHPEIAQGGGGGVARGTFRRAPQAQAGGGVARGTFRRAPQSQAGGGSATWSAPRAQAGGVSAGGRATIRQRVPGVSSGQAVGGGGVASGSLRRAPRAQAGPQIDDGGTGGSGGVGVLRRRGVPVPSPQAGSGAGQLSGAERQRLEDLGYRVTPPAPGVPALRPTPGAPARARGIDALPDDGSLNRGTQHGKDSRYWSDYWNRYWRDFYRAHPGLDPTSTNCSDCHQGLQQWKPVERDVRSVSASPVDALRRGSGR